MPKFFRKFRINAIRDSKIFNYLKYAIGEILLVTIGILIAVSINNANEKRKHAGELQAIYKAVENDLIRDSVFLFQEIEEDRIMDSIIQKVLAQEVPLVSIDTITEENYLECYPCQALHLRYSPFTQSQKGHDALKGFGNNLGDSQDSLSFKILELYSRYSELLEDIGVRLGDLAITSLMEIEQEPWYLSYINGEYNREAIEYFLSDPRYKNRLATFSLLNTKNYVNFLIDYQRESRELIKEIQKRGE